MEVMGLNLYGQVPVEEMNEMLKHCWYCWSWTGELVEVDQKHYQCYNLEGNHQYDEVVKHHQSITDQAF